MRGPARWSIRMRRGSLWIFALVVITRPAFAAQSGAAPRPSRNLALGRPYTISPRPDYPATTDSGDDTQLTDGVYTNGNPIWTRKSTVGWFKASPVVIVIDLQSVQPIAGASFSTAAGNAGVEWPRSIFVLTSDDGRRYFPAGDLVPLVPAAAGPPAAGYAAFRYTTRNLRTHGRYVALLVDTVGPYAFSDEVEVFAGSQDWLMSPLSGPPTTSLADFFDVAHMTRQIQRRVAIDAVEARAALGAADLGEGLRKKLTSELNAVESENGAGSAVDRSTFKAVLPINDLHARIFAVRGAIAEATGLPALTAWAVNPWDFARPLDKPAQAGPQAVTIAAMNGETRAGAFNVSNSTPRPWTASVRLVASDGATPSDIALYHAVWTDTRELTPVADALAPLQSDGASVTLPAGMTQQFWVRFSPSARSPGRYTGYFEITAEGGPTSRVPFELTALPGQFPAQPSMHLGGFDYTDSDRVLGLGLTPNNRDALVRELRALNVDTPWGRANVMPFGTFDERGRLTTAPDTTAFDNWVARWRSAHRYSIFLNAGDDIAGIGTIDARFDAAVAQWITFWVRHAASRGIEASRIAFLLVDEPHTASQDARIVRWAGAIKAAAPGVTIWEDPLYPDPAASAPASLQVSDVLSINRGLMVQYGEPLVSVYRQRARQGQTIEVYGSSGPARLLDPYTYDRLQAWVAADLDATTTSFWSFSDDAGGHSWNEYATTATPYSPFFLSDSDVTISKHTEAIREGVEDVEYLMMLRKRATLIPEADALGLLKTATAMVLRQPGSSDFQWTSRKDRSLADTVRLMVAEELAK